MPVVDLSNIGLEGQQAYATRMATLAQADATRANAEGQRIENEQAQQMQQLNQLASQKLKSVLNRDQSPDIDPADMASKMNSLSDPLQAVGEVYLQGGAMESAKDMFKAAADIRKQENDMRNSNITAEQNRLENIVKGADIVGRWLGGATTEDEWKLGMARVKEAIDNGTFVMEPELFQRIQGLPFDPDAAAFFRDQAITAADKARIDLQKTDDRRQDEQNLATNQDRAARLRLQAARDAESRRHNLQVEKASGNKGGSAAVPTGVEVQQARSALVNSVYKGANTKNDPDVNDAANYVASLAKQYVRDNKALNWDQAIQRAIMQGQASGAFSIEGGSAGINIGPFSFGKKPATDAQFKRTGKTAESAMRPPITGEGKVDVKALKPGTYYILSDGSRGKFNGKGFVLDD